MNDMISSLVCFSTDSDDCSELTGPHDIDVDGISHADDFGIKLAADPYYYHTLDVTQTEGLTTQEEQELLEMKVQIVRQQEKIDMLSSKLSHCEVENEALKAEKVTFIDELALVNQNQRNGHSACKGRENTTSAQSLVDTNTKLRTDNARLQAVADVLRKSFRSYIKENPKKKRSEEYKKKTSCWNHENEKKKLLHRKPSFLPKYEYSKNHSSGDLTAETDPLDSSNITSEMDPQEEVTLSFDISRRSTTQESLQEKKSSLHSIPELEVNDNKFGISGDDCLIGNDIIKNSCSEGDLTHINFMSKTSRKTNTNEPTPTRVSPVVTPRRKSADLVVGFGKRMTNSRPTIKARRSHSLSAGTNTSCTCVVNVSGELLVDFGERPARCESRSTDIVPESKVGTAST